jgi:hypothetical protein
MDHTSSIEGPRSVVVHQYLLYLAHQYGYQRLERHWVLKYRGDLHRYIQTEMDILDISSLSDAYRYVVKMSRNLSTRTSRSSGLQICNNQSMVKKTLTTNLQKISPSHMKRRVMERRRRTLENGAISTKSLGTTLMNVAQKIHWWPRSNTRS